MQSNEAPQMGTEVEADKPARRYDIDWLRVLAVLLLFPFHTARIFDNWGPWYVKNAELSDTLTFFNSLVFPWHMPLLFLLAGASTWFALGFRSGGQYAKERIIRLLVPFIFGLLVKRTNVTRFLLGMRLKKKPAEAPTQPPEGTTA